MIKQLRELLGLDEFPAEADQGSDGTVRLALAALLVEMARADFDQSDGEDEEIARLLATHFRMSESEAGVLLSRAEVALDDAVCLHDFTRSLRKELDIGAKQQVIAMLWQVALADDKLDRYEEYLVRKIADLLYVSASDVVRLKHQAQAE
ncbi:MAG: TerB family tellurite resistance protein [Gammaproteobacteria bacterium]|jgi:uncharacterized tellurite resistance protein B-like protein|nr:TerB family tellurite resistance protein [Gammaproteobacteria bacterium]